MKINVNIDTSGLDLKAQRVRKRLAFATAQALNDTVLDMQVAERANLDRKFAVRKHAFFYRLIKIFTFASVGKDRAYAEIGIDNTKARVLLSEFEKGGVKKSEKGKNVAVPITGSPARPTFRRSVAPSLTFDKMKLRLHQTHTGKRQWKGEKRTFLIPDVGIFQRVGAKGRKKRDVALNVGRGSISFAARKQTTARLIYRLKPRALLKATLEFVKTAQETFAQKWEENFWKRFGR